MESLGSVFSLKEIIEKAVRDSFESKMLTSFSVIENDMRQRFESDISHHKKEIKKIANALTLELLQKYNVHGISVELKL